MGEMNYGEKSVRVVKEQKIKDIKRLVYDFYSYAFRSLFKNWESAEGGSDVRLHVQPMFFLKQSIHPTSIVLVYCKSSIFMVP